MGGIKKLISKITLFTAYLFGKPRQVVAAIIERDGKYLIAKRRRGDVLGGLWEFPGGKIELDESPEDCLKRELKEELGIEAEASGFFCSTKFKYHHISIELLAYKARYLKGDIKVKDHDEVKWVARDEFKDYEFTEADRPVVAALSAKRE